MSFSEYSRIITYLRPYYRRATPPASYTPQWLSIEFDNVEQAIPPCEVVKVVRSDPVGSRDFAVMVDATAGNITIGVPPADQARNRKIIFKKIDNSGNTVSLSQPVDGAALTLSSQYESAVIISDGAFWWKVG